MNNTRRGVNLTSERNRKRDRKKSILEAVSKVPTMDSQAKLATLGAAMNKNKTGLNNTGTPSLPDNR